MTVVMMARPAAALVDVGVRHCHRPSVSSMNVRAPHLHERRRMLNQVRMLNVKFQPSTYYGRHHHRRLTGLSRRQRRPSASRPLFFASSPSSTPTPPVSSTSQEFKNFLSVNDCINLLKRNNTAHSSVHFLDATWFHKGSRCGRTEFLKGPRIPRSQYFDIMDIAMNGDVFPQSNPNNLCNMFPPIQLLKSALDKMGIPSDRTTENGEEERSTTIVIYGRDGTLFTPRVWYMLKSYFETNPSVSIRIMDEPFEVWIEQGGPIDDTTYPEQDTNDRSDRTIWSSKDLVHDYLKSSSIEKLEEYPMDKVAQQYLVDKNDVLNVVEQHQQSDSDPSQTQVQQQQLPLIVDTRGSSYANGHMPSSVHIPYSSLTMDGNPLKLKPRSELVEILSTKLGFDVESAITKSSSSDTKTTTAGPQKARPVLLTCGSAVSVCHMALVLDELGYPYEPTIYDGSWNEWGSDPSTPKVVVSS